MRSDPSRRQSSFLLAGSVVLGTAVLCWAALAFQLPARAPETNQAAISTPSADAASVVQRLDPAAWSGPAWEKPAPKPAAPAAPVKQRDVRLIAVMPRGGRLVAAIQSGPRAPLVYLAAGESRDGIAVTTVEPGRVQATIDGTDRRLELTP